MMMMIDDILQDLTTFIFVVLSEEFGGRSSQAFCYATKQEIKGGGTLLTQSMQPCESAQSLSSCGRVCGACQHTTGSRLSTQRQLSTRVCGLYTHMTQNQGNVPVH